MTRRIIIILSFLYCLGVWTGLALAVRSWSASMIDTVNRDANRVDRRSQPLEARGLILDSLTPWALPRDQVTYYSAWTPR